LEVKSSTHALKQLSTMLPNICGSSCQPCFILRILGFGEGWFGTGSTYTHEILDLALLHAGF
jgi:hypothetical protein